MEANLATLFLVALIAVAAPLVTELPIKLRLPIVVVEIALGIVVGPHVLGWAQPVGVLAFLGTLGLAFLFFLAGLELNFEALRGAPLRLGISAWAVTIVPSLRALPIGSCASVNIDLRDAATKGNPRNAKSVLVSLSDFDKSIRSAIHLYDELARALGGGK